MVIMLLINRLICRCLEKMAGLVPDFETVHSVVYVPLFYFRNVDRSSDNGHNYAAHITSICRYRCALAGIKFDRGEFYIVSGNAIVEAKETIWRFLH